MEKFTWADLAAAIILMPEEFQSNQVCISVEDESEFRTVPSLEKIEQDIYVNNDDDEDCGPLEELREMHGEDFDISNYRLATPKGTPFLWDGI
jgi:hypothetical protein